MDKRRKRILNLLEEGHITAEEADRLLEDLEEDRSKHDDYFGTRFKDDVRSFSEGVKHFIDDTVQRFKEGPFEFNFSHSLVRRSFTFQTSDVKNLNVDLTHTTLKFLPAESDEISVNCKAKVFKEEDSEKAEEFFNQEFHIELINETLNIEQTNKRIYTELTIYLPEKTYDKASLKSVNGSISIRSARFNQASISTVNGRVKIEDYVGSAFYVETRQGSIRVEDSKIDKAKLTTTTGSIFFDGKVDQLNVHVTTGSVRSYIQNNDASLAHIEATTGSVQLYVPEDTPLNGTAQTSVGQVSIKLDDVSKDFLENQMLRKVIHFSKASGSDDLLDIDLSTKTGSIIVYPLTER